ncbi:MAG TPA: hypothetical protein VKK31_08560 [Thermoanaerobaculia bacterium]|nr:hypothetical protein [Thermoanaerobaculia bacterium]
MNEREADRLARIEMLLGESRGYRYDDPQEMVYLAELARAVVDRLDAGLLGDTVVADLRARVWAELGNAYRLADALDLADAAMGQAVRCFEEGSHDSGLLTLISDRLATLLCHRRRFSEAFKLLDRIHSHHLSKGEDHLAGRALVTRGLYMANSGEPGQAILVTCEGLSRLDLARDPALTLSAVHNLLLCAAQLGRFALARRLLELVKPLYESDQNRLNLLRLRWVAGQVAAGLGEVMEAESAFQEVRSGFLAAGLVFPASMVSLDLALLWAEQGRTAEIRDLALELIASFRALGVGREATIALVLLRRACEEEEVALLKVREAIQRTAALIRDLDSRRAA